MTVVRNVQGEQITLDPCPLCGKLTRRTPRAGKRRYRHQCPHGVRCPLSVMPNALHMNNYPPAGGCPRCRVVFWEHDRQRRGRHA